MNINCDKDKISWKKISDTPIYSGYRSLIKRVFEMPNGQLADFDLYNGGQVVCILALTQDQQVILTRQFRPAQETILMEIPGGGIKSDEDPETAAKRELLEETGYVGRLEFVGTSLQSAYDTLARFNYVALDCEKIQEPQLEDNSEPIEVTTMSIPQFRKHLQSGNLTDITTGYLGLDHLGLL